MKKTLLILVIITTLISCNSDTDNLVDNLKLSKTELKLNSNEATHEITTESHFSFNKFEVNDILYEISDDNNSNDSKYSDLTISRDIVGNSKNAIIEITNDWFTLIRENRKITVLLKENTTTEIKTLRIYLQVMNYVGTLNIEQDKKPSFSLIKNQIFKSYLLENFDINDDDVISEEEAALVKVIDCYSLEISSLEGIEYFKELKELYCSNNTLTTIDIAGNKKLEVLDIHNNKLKNIDVSRNNELNWLECDNNDITNLDISKNVKLERLICYKNKLKNLNVENNILLTGLYCNNNELSSLDVSKNIKLEYLSFHINKISKISLTSNTEIVTLFCADNNLSKLSLDTNIKIDGLYCKGNKLTTLNLQHNEFLRILDCSNMELLKTIYIKHGAEIEYITYNRSRNFIPDATIIEFV